MAWEVVTSTGAKKQTTGVGWNIIQADGTISMVLTAGSSGIADGDYGDITITDGIVSLDEDGVFDTVAPMIADSGTIYWDRDPGNSEARLMAHLDNNAVTNAKIAAGALFTAATEQASTSGASIDFTGIPVGTQMIIISFVGVSGNVTANMQVQIGSAGGVETSGYNSVADSQATGGGLATQSTTGFLLERTADTNTVRHGQIILTLEDGSDFTWTCSGILGWGVGATPVINWTAGSKSLSQVLDRVRISCGGTGSFDAGAISIKYR